MSNSTATAAEPRMEWSGHASARVMIDAADLRIDHVSAALVREAVERHNAAGKRTIFFSERPLAVVRWDRRQPADRAAGCRVVDLSTDRESAEAIARRKSEAEFGAPPHAPVSFSVHALDGELLTAWVCGLPVRI